MNCEHDLDKIRCLVYLWFDHSKRICIKSRSSSQAAWKLDHHIRTRLNLRLRSNRILSANLHQINRYSKGCGWPTLTGHAGAWKDSATTGKYGDQRCKRKTSLKWSKGGTSLKMQRGYQGSSLSDLSAASHCASFDCSSEVWCSGSQ